MGMLWPGSAWLSEIVKRRRKKATTNFRNGAQNKYNLSVTKSVSIAGGNLRSDSATIP